MGATFRRVGILSTLRELWTGPVAASALALATPVIPTLASTPTPPTKQEGTSGVPNFGGEIWYEPIAELRGQAGYGRSGGEWGFWEDLSAANSFVAAALDHTCSPIGDCRVDIEEIPKELIGSGPGKVTQAIADAMVELLRWNFTEKLQLQAHLGVASRGFLKTGFSLFEPTAELAPDGRWFCSKLSERLPLSLHPNPWMENDAHTTLRAVRQQTVRGVQSFSAEIPAERLLLYIWQRQGTNWQGRSAFRAVQYIAGHVMPTLLKLIGVTLQREGAGIPTAVAADKDAPLDEDQRLKLVELLKSLVFHESANAVMPAGWELKWIFSGGSNKGHVLEVWRELGTVVLQQLSAQQLQLGTGETGSRSVGVVHDARSAAKVKEVLKLDMAVLNGDDGEPFQGLAPRICQWNHGIQAAYPRVKLTMQQPQLPVQDLANAAKTSKEAGLLTPTLNDENTIRERLGLGPITLEEREKERDAAAARAPQLGPPGAPGQSPPKPGDPKSEKKPAKNELEDAKVKASAQRTPWQPWRQLRASELKLPLAERDEYFTSRRDVYEARVRPLLAAIVGKAGPAIARAMSDGKVQPAEIAAVQLKTAKLLELNRGFIAECRSAGAASVRDELMDRPLLASAEEEEQDDREREEVLRTIRDQADDISEAQAQGVTRRQESRIRGEMEREAIDALRTKADAASVVDRVIDRQLETGAFRSDAGYLTTKAFNCGRDEAARILGGIASVEYSAILDSATCIACSQADGKTAAFGSVEHDELLPPNRDCAGGDNCRCFLIMVPGPTPGGDDE